MKIHIDDDLFNKEELKNTPYRYHNFLDEWNKKNKDSFKFTMFKNPGYKGMVMIKDISFSSMCAHHLLPFSGKAHIAYIVGDKICGASKLVRALEKFASKPQTQEKLTLEVIEFLQERLKPKGVAVMIEATHECMRIRGVKNATSIMITSELRGAFDTNPATREEFLTYIRR